MYKNKLIHLNKEYLCIFCLTYKNKNYEKLILLIRFKKFLKYIKLKSAPVFHLLAFHLLVFDNTYINYFPVIQCPIS